MVDKLRAEEWFRFAQDEDDAECRRSDDAFDAVICALVAGAAALDKTRGPKPEDLSEARREGWIHVPTASLTELARLAG